MHVSPRLAALVALCAAAVAGGVFLTGGPAGAAVPMDTISPDVIPPVNVLPSEVTAVTPAGDAYTRAYLMTKYLMSQSTANAALATEAGTESADQTADLATEAETYTQPATKLLPLVKTAGGAVAALGSFQLGTGIGHAVSQMLGTSDNAVCEETPSGALGSVVSFLDGVNCDAYDHMLATAQQNLDSPPGYNSHACAPDGACADFQGFSFAATNGEFDALCFSFSGVGGSSSPEYLNVYVGAGPYPSFSQNHQGNMQFDSPGYPCSPSQYPIYYGYPDTSHLVGISVVDQSDLAMSNTPSAPISQSVADPERHWECSITGHSGTVYTSDSASFKESDASYAPVECPPVPSPDWAIHQTIKEVGGPLPLEVQDQDTTPEYQSAQELYPDCSTGACPLILTPSSPGSLSCQSDPTPCADWFSDPNKTSDYTCTYGPHTVDLSECDLYSPTFQPGAQDSGTALADPATGDPLSGQTTPTPDQTLLQSPATDPTTKGQCFPNGWGVFNPVNWIFQPIQCAFEWAFVPRNSTMKSDGLKIRDAVNASAIGSVGGIITGMGTFSIDGGGCSGIPWNFSIAGLSKTVNLLAACSGDALAATAAVVKSVLTAVVITAGVLASARYIAQIFGYVGFGGIIDAERRQEYRDTARERGGARFK